MKKSLTALGAAVALSAGALSLPAQAYEAGDVLVRFGAIHVEPNVSSSTISVDGTSLPDTKAKVGNDTQFGISFTYLLNQHVGVELLGASPFKHDIKVSGVDGLENNHKLGTTKHLPPTLSLQYYPLGAGYRFQPYVGLGVNHTAFFSKKLTAQSQEAGFSDLKLKNSTGLTGQVGIDVALTERVFVNAAAWYMGIDTKASAKLGDNDVNVDVQIDPMVYMLGLGLKF